MSEQNTRVDLGDYVMDALRSTTSSQRDQEIKRIEEMYHNRTKNSLLEAVDLMREYRVSSFTVYDMERHGIVEVNVEYLESLIEIYQIAEQISRVSEIGPVLKEVDKYGLRVTHAGLERQIRRNKKAAKKERARELDKELGYPNVNEYSGLGKAGVIASNYVRRMIHLLLN